MNPFVFPAEVGSTIPESLLFFIAKLEIEIAQHGLAFWIARKMNPEEENFGIYKKIDGNQNGYEQCERYKTLDELNKNYGHCIRQYGSHESSSSYMEDKFKLPFSVLLMNRDENFKFWLRKEIEFINHLDNLPLADQYQMVLKHDIRDELIDNLYNIAVLIGNILVDQAARITPATIQNGGLTPPEEIYKMLKNQDAVDKAYGDFFKVFYSRMVTKRK